MRDDPLLAAYLALRGDLLRHFRVRLRSDAAAEDLVQEIYLKVAELGPTEVASPGAFLFRLGTNLMLDRLKQARRAARRDEAWQDAAGDTSGGLSLAVEPPADDVLAARQTLGQVLSAVEELPAGAREAFRLHKIEGLSHAQTAEQMGVSRSSVEKYIMSALRLISRRVRR